MFSDGYKNFFLLTLGAFVVIPGIVFALNTIVSGFQVSSTPVSIDAHGVCQKVNATDGKTYFVPTNTSTEWSAFRANKPAGVMLSSCVTPGSREYSTPGTYTFVAPPHNSLTVELWGAGGAGVGYCNTQIDTNPGGSTTWDGSTLIAGGGGAGITNWRGGAGGSGGSGSGGSINVTGQIGGAFSAPYTPGGKGGNGANGGAGGVAVSPGQSFRNGNPGIAPGGGGSGGITCGRGCNWFAGGGGGGYTSRMFAEGEYEPGNPVSIVIGAGGVPTGCNSFGGSGAAGRATIRWE